MTDSSYVVNRNPNEIFVVAQRTGAITHYAQVVDGLLLYFNKVNWA